MSEIEKMKEYTTLRAVPLAVWHRTEAPIPAQTNNERFNALLNNCQNPRAVYNALAAFAGAKKGAAV